MTAKRQKPEQLLDSAMDAQRRNLGLTWDDVAQRADISYEAVRRVRQTGKMRPLTARGIEKALQWSEGSVEAILAGGEPVIVESLPMRVITGERGEVDTRAIAAELYSLYLERPSKFHARRLEVSRDHPEHEDEIQYWFGRLAAYGWATLEGERDAN